ncbi:unnamed protein product [Leptosia nina]|uniref:Uncharacterized protein n=1 Tax=Leptosia nina TaxID=320188 RepID=A0AAV1IUG7_9NEOP
MKDKITVAIKQLTPELIECTERCRESFIDGFPTRQFCCDVCDPHLKTRTAQEALRSPSAAEQRPPIERNCFNVVVAQFTTLSL